MSLRSQGASLYLQIIYFYVEEFLKLNNSEFLNGSYLNSDLSQVSPGLKSRAISSAGQSNVYGGVSSPQGWQTKNPE